ncbi:MAG: cell division protein FtsZ [Anaerolineales bacterium]|nr:cell division protein FtsZ [Anaerolineales bacterium]
MILNPEATTDPAQDSQAGFTRPVLKVLGLGGGGCNAVARMIELGLKGVDFIAANTDRQVLLSNPAETKILLGPEVTRGFGAGGEPERGRQAAEESRAELEAALAGADMVFLTAGMGGGTGTGSIPVVAEMARSLNAVTVAIVTMPFTFENGRRMKNANEGLVRLRQHTHTLITIPNDRLLEISPQKLPIETSFRLADDVLRQSVQGITELITLPGMINVDFAHIRRLILLGGGALMSIGQAEGEGKSIRALRQALHHPFMQNVSLDHAAGVIANFTGGKDLTLMEVQESLCELQAHTGSDTEIVMGVINDDGWEGRTQVILLVTGIGGTPLDLRPAEQALASSQKAAPLAGSSYAPAWQPSGVTGSTSSLPYYSRRQP